MTRGSMKVWDNSLIEFHLNNCIGENVSYKNLLIIVLHRRCESISRKPNQTRPIQTNATVKLPKQQTEDNTGGWLHDP